MEPLRGGLTKMYCWLYLPQQVQDLGIYSFPFQPTDLCHQSEPQTTCLRNSGNLTEEIRIGYTGLAVMSQMENKGKILFLLWKPFSRHPRELVLEQATKKARTL